MKKRIAAVSLLLVLSLAVTALAGGLTKSIQITTGVTVKMDGEPLEYRYEDGTEIEPFLYNNVTYVPIRAVSEAQGLDVDWDQETMTVSITSPDTASKEPGHDGGESPSLEGADEIRYAESYDEVAEALRSVWYDTGRYGYATGAGVAVEEALAVDSASSVEYDAAAAEPTANAAVTAGAGDYSGTNVQVAGVDEGDIVKTDGEYIYILRSFDLIIVKADGDATDEDDIVSVTNTGEYNYVEEMPGYDYYWSSCEKCCEEMYVSGDRLAIVSYLYDYKDYEDEDGQWGYEDNNHLCLDIYDISDRTAPVLLAELGQDGWSMESRMMDDTVYLISSYYVYEQGDDPVTYCPCFYAGSTAEAALPGDIAILPEVGSSEYTVIGAYCLTDGTRTDSLCLLGGSDTVYMTGETLYLAGTVYCSEALESRKESVYTVESYLSGQVTELVRIDLDGSLDADACGSVPGALDSQFSMDAYDGYLRLVTTESGSRWRTYTDEEYGFVNYEWDDSYGSNALFVLDADLTVVGSIEGLAEDEFIYSARFDGEIAYFCTYRNTDPLFAVDLSDPEAPVVLSELKITGFSDYLHTWDEGLLFGLGMEADEETGGTTDMKLVMFDTSDSKDVTVADTALLDESWSIALYNHKACLISAEKDLICFPAGSSFYVYGYTAEEGFVRRGCIDLEINSYDARALYIGSCLYIADTQAVYVLDLGSMQTVAELSLPESEIGW